MKQYGEWSQLTDIGFIEGSDPATPAAGTLLVYAKSTGTYSKNSAGVVSLLGSTITTDSSSYVANASLTTSVAASALTITLQDKAGSTPSSTSPVTWGFRSTTLTVGTYTSVSATAATTLVVPSGATLGTSNATASTLYVYALNNAGTIELAISSTMQDERRLVTTTTIGAGSTSATGFYSTTGRSNVACRFIGCLQNTQTTAGTWAAVPTNDDVQHLGNTPATSISAGLFIAGQAPGTPSSADAAAGNVGEYLIQSRVRSAGFGITSTAQVNVTASPLVLTAGDWDLTGAVVFSPAGTTNVTVWQAGISVTSATFPSSDYTSTPNTAGEIRTILSSNGVVTGNDQALNLPTHRVSLSTTTTFYLVASSNFTVSTNSVSGGIWARRVR